MEKANIKSYDTSPKIRYAWVDYAKFFSIFLVVSYHIPHRADGYVGELLSLLRMPAFFMIAGFLFNTNKFHSLSYFLKHRSIQLLIPYISFFTFFYISWYPRNHYCPILVYLLLVQYANNLLFTHSTIS